MSGVSRSTLHDHVSGEVEQHARKHIDTLANFFFLFLCCASIWYHIPISSIVLDIHNL